MAAKKKQGYLDREAEKTPGKGKGKVTPKTRAKMARGARKADTGTGKGSYGFKKKSTKKKARAKKLAKKA